MFNIVLKEKYFIVCPTVAVWSAAENLEEGGQTGFLFSVMWVLFSLLAHRIATFSCYWSGGSGAVIIVVPVFQDLEKQFSAA